MFGRASVVASIAVTAGALGFGIGVPGAGAVGPQGLYVTFRSDHTITVTLNDGSPVGTTSGAPTVIPPGQYDVFMDDSATVEGPTFDLVGPGVSLVTSMFLGEDPSETFTEIFLASSTYTWRNDEHPNAVFTFTTIASSGTGGSSGGSSGSSGTSSTGSSGKTTSKDVVGSAIDKTAVFRGTLAGTVSAAEKLTLTKSGKGVTTLKSGRYTFTIQDSSSKADFTIQELRKNPLTLTGVAFVGKHTTTVNLKPGQWTFYSFSGKTNYFVVIS